MLSKVIFGSGRRPLGKNFGKHFSSTNVLNANENHSCKVLVVGGGTGGCTIAAKFCKSCAKNEVIIIEPSDDHYYQALFTLVGGGMKTLSDSRRSMASVLPKGAKWIKDEVVEFDVKSNTVRTKKGHTVKYDGMVIATGLKLDYHRIPGMAEGLSLPDNVVCSNYSPNYVERTFKAMQAFKSGNAIFTYPVSSVKCPGAPQKACYIAEHYFRKQNKRHDAHVIYNTSLPVIFGVKPYADALWKVCKQRNIEVNTSTALTEIRPDEKKAVFVNLDKPDEKTVLEYSLLHVTPPMDTPEVLSKNKDLTNKHGFVSVDKNTMQHVKYPNVFAIGDCSSSPNSKTAAAAACQAPVVYKNLSSVLSGKSLNENYDGYASCPLVTGYKSCILAEFDYDLQPLETLPFRQDRELYLAFILKTMFLPPMYWHLMLTGHWNGPAFMRKALHLDFSSKTNKNCKRH